MLVGHKKGRDEEPRKEAQAVELVAIELPRQTLSVNRGKKVIMGKS